jgi:hypothetical protein
MAAERLELPAFCHLAFVVGVIARLAPNGMGSVCRAVAREVSEGWWAVTGSNRRHPACKAGALPLS